MVKDYDWTVSEMCKSKDQSVESNVNDPFVHNLPKGSQLNAKCLRSVVFKALMEFKERKCTTAYIKLTD